MKTKPLSNLHRAWDRSFGSDSFRNTRNIAIQLRRQNDFARIREGALDRQDPVLWRDETYGVARDLAYNREVFGQLKSLELKGGDIKTEPVQLSEHYLRQRRLVADHQAVMAGVRLAAVLEEVP